MATPPSSSVAMPVRSASGRPLDVEVALESLSTLLASPPPGGSPTKANGAASAYAAARAAAVAGGSGGSGRSLSPPPRTVSGSRLHLHPTSTPPRVSGSAILHSVASKKLFAAPSSAASSSSRANDVKSAATAAFIKAQEAAKKSRPSASGAGNTLGVFGLAAATLKSPSATSPSPAPPAASSPGASAAGADVGSPSFLLPPHPALPRVATYRSTMESSLVKSIRVLMDEGKSRHAQQVQTHFVAGLLALRRGEWQQAEVALRKADQMYKLTLERGSGIARLENEEKNPTLAATTDAPPAAEESKDAEPEEIELTQPMETDELPLSQPIAPTSSQPDDATAAPAVRTSSVAPTPFVSRKAADIKLCLAISIWKGAYHHASQCGGGTRSEEASRMGEAKELFVDALELEQGGRMMVWNAFATFLAATHSVQVGKSILVHALASHSPQQQDGEAAALGLLHRARSDSPSDWAIDSLRNNLACLHLLSGEPDEAVLTWQEILERNTAAAAEPEGEEGEDRRTSSSSPHHLTAMSNYSVLCMKQGDFASAEKLIRLLLQMDPCNATYWAHLALCLELQTPPNYVGQAPAPLNLTGSDAAAKDASKDEAKKAETESAKSDPAASSKAEPASTPSEADRRKRMIQFAYEKARFYEEASLDADTRAAVINAGAASGDPSFVVGPSSQAESSPLSPASWPFRLNLAQHLLSLARNETSSLQVRNHHYSSCESLLLSIKHLGAHLQSGAEKLERREKQGRSEVWTALGDLYAARSVSALLDPPSLGGGSEGSKTYKLQSISAYARALDLHPFNQTAWNQLSVLFMHSGDARKALVFLERLVGRIKKDLGVSAEGESGGKGAKKEESKQLQPATAKVDDLAAHYTPLFSSDLSHLSSTASPAQLQHLGSILCNLGICFQLLSADDQAEKAYMDSLKLASEQAPTYMNLGNLYRSLQQTDSSLRCFSRALELKPDYAMCWSNVALLYVQQEDWIMAYHCMEKAHLHGPHLNTVRSNRSRLSLLLTKLGFSIPLPPPSSTQTFSTVAAVNAAMNRSFRAPLTSSSMATMQPMMPIGGMLPMMGMMPTMPPLGMTTTTTKGTAPPAAAASSNKKRAASSASSKKKTATKRRKGAAASTPAAEEGESSHTEASVESTDVEDQDEEME